MTAGPEVIYLVTQIRDLSADPQVMPKSVRFTQDKPIRASTTILCRIAINTAFGWYDPQKVYVVSETTLFEGKIRQGMWQFWNDRVLSGA